MKQNQSILKTTIKTLKRNSQLPRPNFLYLLSKLHKLLTNEPSLISIPSPITILGDIHGQYYDLLNIFERFGYPPETNYLLLGDYVDRGYFCIEVFTLLMILKITYPSGVFLLRGNHESRMMTSNFNFRMECLHKYDQDVYEMVMEVFQALPLAAIVDKQYFCVHAGLSPDLSNISQIASIKRFVEPPEYGLMCDLLWSDPSPNEKISVKWKKNNNRKCSYFFSKVQSKSFLLANNLKMIIRGHQVQKQGYKYQKDSQSSTLVLTVFSAPNYCDSYRNKGAVARIRSGKVAIFTYGEVPHPIVLQRYQNIVEWSFPILVQKVTSIFLAIMKMKIRDESVGKGAKEQLKLEMQIQFFDDILMKHREIMKEKMEEAKVHNSLNIQDVASLSQEFFNRLKDKDENEKYPNQAVIGPKVQFTKTILKQTMSEQVCIWENETQ